MIQEIKAHQTSDGKLFESISEAEEHEEKIDIKFKVECFIDSIYFDEMDKKFLIEEIIEYLPTIKSWFDE